MRDAYRYTPNAGAIGALYGIRIGASGHLRDGLVWKMPDGSIIIGTRPLTELEAAGREARLIVRHGLAGVLEWLGMPLDLEPPGREILDRLDQLTRR